MRKTCSETKYFPNDLPQLSGSLYSTSLMKKLGRNSHSFAVSFIAVKILFAVMLSQSEFYGFLSNMVRSNQYFHWKFEIQINFQIKNELYDQRLHRSMKNLDRYHHNHYSQSLLDVLLPNLTRHLSGTDCKGLH